MRWTSWKPDVSLELTATQVTLRDPSETTVSREAFDAGALHPEVMRALSNVALVQCLAELRYGPLPHCEAPEGRPRVERIAGFGRRGQIAPGYWIFGRVARMSHTETRDVPLAEIARDASLADMLPAPLAASLVAAARALDAQPCMCGTGAETASQHGDLETLVNPTQHPDAPITCEASVARCRVCGRIWGLLAEGDDHYDWRFEMTPYRGPTAS